MLNTTTQHESSVNHWRVSHNKNGEVVAELPTLGEHIKVNLTPEQARSLAAQLNASSEHCEDIIHENEILASHEIDDDVNNPWIRFSGEHNPVASGVLVDIRLCNGIKYDGINSSVVSWSLQNAVSKGYRIKRFRLHKQLN